MFDQVEVQEMKLRLMRKFSELREKTLAMFDQATNDIMEMLAALNVQIQGKCRWQQQAPTPLFMALKPVGTLMASPSVSDELQLPT